MDYVVLRLLPAVVLKLSRLPLHLSLQYIQMIKVTYDIPTRSSGNLASENAVNHCHYSSVQQIVGAARNPLFCTLVQCDVMLHLIYWLCFLRSKEGGRVEVGGGGVSSEHVGRQGCQKTLWFCPNVRFFWAQNLLHQRILQTKDIS